jgi:hypothetical protein
MITSYSLTHICHILQTDVSKLIALGQHPVPLIVLPFFDPVRYFEREQNHLRKFIICFTNNTL